MQAVFATAAGKVSGGDTAKFVDTASQWTFVAREHFVVASK
jgi:hypothetical protein